jgi:hypothetical protein
VPAVTGSWYERLVDLLERLETDRASGEVRFKTELGPASIWFDRGRIIDAQIERATGQAAIFRLMSLPDASFQLQHGRIDRKGTISETTRELIELRARRSAEWHRLVQLIPSLDTIPAIDRTILDAYRGRLAEDEYQLLGLVDRRRTILELIDDSGMDAVGVLERIVAYFDAGILVIAPITPSTFPEP